MGVGRCGCASVVARRLSGHSGRLAWAQCDSLAAGHRRGAALLLLPSRRRCGALALAPVPLLAVRDGGVLRVEREREWRVELRRVELELEATKRRETSGAERGAAVACSATRCWSNASASCAAGRSRHMRLVGGMMTNPPRSGGRSRACPRRSRPARAQSGTARSARRPGPPGEPSRVTRGAVAVSRRGSRRDDVSS